MIKSTDRSDYFRFKQFRMVNGNAGLKIGTDGVLLGAWTNVADVSEMWDVGTGTGLVALMLAQRSDARITAFELDDAACRTAERNFALSEWRDRITLAEGDVFATQGECPRPDLIVSNPPFYDRLSSLAAKSSTRDLARRDGALSFASLIELAACRLSADGRLALISPADRDEEITWLAALNRFSVSRRTEVITKTGKRASRILWELSRGNCACRADELAIRDANGDYTRSYIELTKSYYIHF